MQLSVIAAVYNCENTIERCIVSVIKQKNIKLELIIIDDGSSDKTLEISQRYANEFNNIILLQQKKQGEYITFIDGDDYIDLNMYENLLKNNNFEILITDFFKEDEFGNKLVQENSLSPYEGKIQDNEKFQIIKKMITSQNMGSIWRCIYLKKFIIDNNLYFYDKVYRGADLLFNIDCLKKSKNIIYDKSNFYHYVYYTNSISNSITINNWSDFRIINSLLNKSMTNSLCEELNIRYQGTAIWMMFSLAKNNNHIGLKRIIEDLCNDKVKFNLNQNHLDSLTSKIINTRNRKIIYFYCIISSFVINLKNGVLK